MHRITTGLVWKAYVAQFGLPGTNKLFSIEYRRRRDEFHDRLLVFSLLDRS